MTCPQCQRDNEEDATFCTNCGSRLERLCPKCQTSNITAARFCKRCGQALTVSAPVAPPKAAEFPAPHSYTPKHLAEKILVSRSALEGERKQVTVLFVDVSGFTSLSERLDPEDVHRLMTRAFELMLAEVHRYEGTVNQFLGDGIMALFGAPIAHEDHARRALHAALGIRAVLGSYEEELRGRRGIGFQVRQGVNTGLVVVGSIGTDLRMDYTAVGDTTNVAARLQQTAERGRILISDATHRLTEGYFHTRALGELQVKGKAEPIRGFELIAAKEARTRLDVGAERGLTPYVGRERELQLLRQCFDRAKVGQGQVVFIAGEAGIGKSRLLHEFRRQLGDEATWVEGRCMSFGQSIAFYPIIDMLKRNFRIEEGDPEGTIGRSTHLFASLGELALARGDRDGARRFTDECLEIASRTNARRYLVKGWRLRGQIGLARGDAEEAEQSLRAALKIAQLIQPASALANPRRARAAPCRPGRPSSSAPRVPSSAGRHRGRHLRSTARLIACEPRGGCLDAVP